jgi:hypothetical protein
MCLPSTPAFSEMELVRKQKGTHVVALGFLADLIFEYFKAGEIVKQIL